MKYLFPLLVLLSCSADNAPQEESVLRFTAIPDTNSAELTEKFTPVAAYLSEQLGRPVEYVATSDYSASVEMFKNGDVHFAWFGGLSGAQARAAVPGSQAIAQGVEDPNFKTYFVANENFSLARSESFPMELRNASFTFGSAKSTSGRLMPEHFIKQNTGEEAPDFFGKENSYSGSHDKTAKLVEAGTFQAGAVNYLTYERMVKEGTLDPKKCRIVWVTPGYPDYNWTAHGDLNPELIENIQKALVGMNSPKLLKAMDRPNGLIPATNADFQPIHDLASELGFL